MKLSICIPTYNFAKFIGATLDSIIPQLNDEIEVVILDGASTDNTEEIVRSYRERHPQIRYFRESKRGGIDKDMHLSIEKAKGEYCWLFSSDDLIKKGALEQVLAEIKLGLDVYVCGFTICSFDMASVIQEYRFSTLDKPTTFDLSKQDSRRSYFESALATPTFFSFMSSLIIKRKRWIETPIESSFFNTCWAHAGRIFRMIPHGLKVKHIPNSFLDKRSGNDSFMDKGFIHRISIAIDGYQHISDTVFGHKSHEAFHIRRALRNEFTVESFLTARKCVKKIKDARELIRLIWKTYSDHKLKKWMIMAEVIMVPGRIICLARRFRALEKKLRVRLTQRLSFVRP